MYLHHQGHLSLTALPNELILHILINLRTVELAPLSSVCHRIYDIVARLLAHRLRRVACLNSHSLLLEGYHPSQRLTEPPYPCIYLGTDSLDAELHSDHHASLPPGQRLHDLANFFSKFQPYRRHVERVNLKHPAGDIPGSRTYRNPNDAARTSAVVPPRLPAAGPLGADAPGPTVLDSPLRDGSTVVQRETFEPVIQSVHLEAGVRFWQLCADLTVTIAGPKPGLFVGLQHIEKGVVRVFRDWLADRAALDAAEERRVNPLVDAGESEDDGGAECEAVLAADGKGKDTRSTIPDVRSDKGVLWVGNRYKLGIRLKVQQPRWRPQHSPILVQAEEELPVSYEIEYQELLVRTIDLLLASEKADERHHNSSGKAIVIGTFA